MHFLGSDIRGKPPDELAWAQRAGARIVGSYDAIRWVPDADVVPPGIDLRRVHAAPADRPRAPGRRPRPLEPPPQGHRARDRRLRASSPVDLEIVEGLHHDEARRRYEDADIVVDQLNAGWYGLFAIEAMALGKPVVTFLHEEAVARTEDAFGTTVPIVSATAETLAAHAPAARRGRRPPPPRRRTRAAPTSSSVHDIERIADRLLDIYARL